MITKNQLSVLTIALIMLWPVTTSIYAQNASSPPIPVELFLGNNRANFQLSMNKPIAGKWRFNNITTAVADYENYYSETELVMVNSLIYQFHKNFGASGGIQYHFRKGLVPNIAVHASYSDPTWLLLITPYLNFMPQYNSETIAIAEYKPRIDKNIRLYTRIQALYNHNISFVLHDRSFYYFRAGLTINKYSFGLAANLDYYTDERIAKNNFGAFVKVDI